MSSHSASKDSEPGEPAAPTVAEVAAIEGQDPTDPTPTHASGLRERVQPPPGETPPRADSGEGLVRRLAAPDGDELRAAIELAKRRLAQSSPPTAATPTPEQTPTAAAQPGPLPAADDELQAAIEAAKQRLSAAASWGPLSALSEREPSRFPSLRPSASRTGVEPQPRAESSGLENLELERHDAPRAQRDPVPPEEEEAAPDGDSRAVIERSRQGHAPMETEDGPSTSLTEARLGNGPLAGDGESSETLDAALAAPAPVEPATVSSQTPMPEGPGPTEDGMAVAASSATLPASPYPDPGLLARAPRRRWALRLLPWTMVLAVVFVLGTAFGQSQRGIRWTRTVRALAAKYMNASRAKAVPSRPKPAPKAQRQKPEVEPDPIPLLEDKPSDQRTLNEAVAIGHHWLNQSTEQFEALSEQLKLRPELLTDEATRERLVGFVTDRTTSVQALELLARMATPAALDVLYEVWIGSKDRTDTTRLAEALLLAADVRPHAGPALELALALRDRPTDCGQIRKLVETALEVGDRRSAMLLVRAASRKDCTKGSSTVQCMLCLDDARKMRAAIKAAAGRLGPIFYYSTGSSADMAGSAR